jgi:DNA-binding transcriptional LysR family regulator
MDELAIVAPPGHPAASDPHEAELRSARWVLREAGAGTRESFDAWTASWPTPPQVVLTAGGNALIVAAVSAGIGLSCLSAAAVAGELQRGELVRVPVSAPELMRTLSLVQRRDGHADRALDAFLAVLDDPEADPQSSVV